MPDTSTSASSEANSHNMVVNRASGKYYFIVSSDGETVCYRRYVDMATYELPEEQFRAKFRPATQIEKDLLVLCLDDFIRDRIIPNTRNVSAHSVRTSAAELGINLDEPNEEQVMLERRGQRSAPEVGELVETTERDTFENLILHPDTLVEVKTGLVLLQHRDSLDSVFGISRIAPQSGKSILNFHGRPGTGKTRTALVVARMLGKKLYQVNYAQMISKYVGDTAKHISQAFARAKALGAVLFWDEADSLCSRRLNSDEAISTSINQNRNVLMQELDRFDGVVLLGTNFMQNYDPAITRRIARNVEFRLPTVTQRASIFALHFPVMDRVEVVDGFQRIAKIADGFSGGDILNVAVNAMQRAALNGAPETWKITEYDVIREVVTLHRVKLANGLEAEIEENDLRGKLQRAESALAAIVPDEDSLFGGAQ